MDVKAGTSNLTDSAVITSQDELIMHFGVWSQQPDGIPEVVGHMLLKSLMKLYARAQTGTEELHPYLGSIVENLGSTFTEAVSNNTAIDWTKITSKYPVTRDCGQSPEANLPKGSPTIVSGRDASSDQKGTHWSRGIGRKCYRCFQQNSECLPLMPVGGRGCCIRCSKDGLKCSYLEGKGRRPERKEDQQAANVPSAVQTAIQPNAASCTSHTDQPPPPIPTSVGSNTVVNKKCLQCRPCCPDGIPCISTNGRKSCDLCISKGYNCSLEFPPQTVNEPGAGNVPRQNDVVSSLKEPLPDVVSGKRKPAEQPGTTSRKRVK